MRKSKVKGQRSMSAQKCGMASCYLLLTNSSGHFAAFGGAAPLNFLYAVQISQDLLAHTTSGMGVPLKI